MKKVMHKLVYVTDKSLHIFENITHFEKDIEKACVSSLNSSVALAQCSELEIFGARVFTQTSIINAHLNIFFSFDNF